MFSPSFRRDNSTFVCGAYLRVVPCCDGRNFLPPKLPFTITSVGIPYAIRQPRTGASGEVVMGTEWYGTAPAKSACEQFHIRTDWPVLVVEDTEDRISWFRQRMPKAVFAKNAEAALRALSEQEFKVAFLDHDLHWMHADNSIFKGTGKEVARFMAQQGFKGIVIIHSKHVEGAAIMKKFLPNARLAPFETFDIVSEVNL
jgi:hypothetical protein